MSYTTTNGQPQGYAYTFINKLREALIGEIVAINGYANHIANSNMEQINAAWRSIMKDEKEHYGMFLTLIRKYDPMQYNKYLEHMNTKVNVTSLQTYQPEYNKQLILNNIREDVKGELEAVILYEQLWNEITIEDVKNVLYTVIQTEKGHAEHLTRLLINFDPDKYDGLT